MAELSAADFGGPQELDPSAFSSTDDGYTAGDYLLGVKRGIQQLPGALTGLADIPIAAVTGERYADKAATALGEATGFQPAKWAKENGERFSPGAQKAMRDVGEAWQESGADRLGNALLGNWEDIPEAWRGTDLSKVGKTLVEHPGYVANQVIESAPSMLAGGAIAKGLTAGKIIANPILAGAAGEGAIAGGQNMDQTDRSADPRKAAAAAAAAGTLDALIAGAGGKLASRLGLEDVQTRMAGGQAEAKGLSMPAKIAGGMASEGVLQELPQSMNEQIWQNVAEDKPLGEGVLRQGVEGMLAGAVMGGGANALPQAKAPAAPAPATDTELDAANAELAGAIAADEAVPGDLLQLGYDPSASVITVPTQSGGTTTIDRNTGPLSAAVVDSGAADMLATGTLLQSYPTKFAAQAALNAREDADQMEVQPHPSAAAKGRFAIVPKPAQVLDANQIAAERQAQLQDEEEANTKQIVALHKQASTIERSVSDNTSPADAKAAREQAAKLRAQAQKLATQAEDAQAELAPQPAQPVAEMPGVQAQSAEKAAQARESNETRAASLIDEEASAANPEPSDAQIEAGNYRKGHVKVGPLNVAIENPAGSTRRGKGWTVRMRDHYGYVKRTKGADGDQVDVYIKPGTDAGFNGTIYVVDQFDPATGRFDEHKAMIGYRSHAEASAAYDAHFSDKSGPKRRAAVVAMPMETFARWAKEGDTSRPISRAANEMDAAQAEIEQSTGKFSKGRQGNETPEQYYARKAAEANAKRERRKAAAKRERRKAAAAVASETPASETPEQYHARKAAEANAKRERRKAAAAVATETPASETLRRTLGEDAEVVQAKDLPSQSEANAAGNLLSRQAANTLELLAKLFKKQVVLFRAGENTDGFWIDGKQIFINVDNPRSGIAHLNVLGHELTHAMKKEAPEAYQAMLSAVSSLLTEEEIRAAWQDYHGEALESDITEAQRELITEEWMSDLAGNRFGEAGFWESVYQAIEDANGSSVAKSVIAKLRLAIVNAINKLVSTLRGQKFGVDARLADSLDQIRAAVAEGFTAYAKSARAGSLEQTGAGEAKFSTLPSRWPTSAKSKPSVNDPMLADLETLKQTPDLLEKAVSALAEEPGMKTKAKSVNGKLEAVLGRLVDNLLWLHDLVPPEIRQRSKLWYDGANVIANNWAKAYKKTTAQAAGILAVLSPQKDWFMNVTMAERVLDILSTQMGHKFDAKMKGAAFQFLLKDQQKPADKRNNSRAFNKIKGLTLAETIKLNDPLATGVWLRAYDEAHHAAEHAVIHPEGDFGDNATTVTGSETLRAWGDFKALGKAASIFVDGSPENINAKLGGEHKVRNFYNNIFNPKDARFATIDTHAVAADMLRPLAGADKPVADNFGGAGSSNLTGVSGTYPIHFEAYKRAAEARGVLPREMQSITWEAVRGLFTEGFKGKKDNLKAVDDIWRQVDAGKLTLDQARDQIMEKAGGVEHPDWWNGNEPMPAGRVKSYKQERPAFKGTKIAFEVAPDPNNKALTARWNALPEEAKAEISYSMAWDTSAKVLAHYNSDTLKGELHTQVGGYLEDTNPSFSLWMNKYASMVKVQEIARALGFALNQDSMVVGSPKKFKGGVEMGVVVIQNVSDANAKKVYDELRAAIRTEDGRPLINGHTTAENDMAILVDSGTELSIGERVAKQLEGKHDVYVDATFVQWPERGENDYGFSGTKEDSGPESEPSLGKYLRGLREETGRELEQRIAAVKRSEGRSVAAGEDRLSNIRVGQGGRVDVSGIHFSKEQRQHLSGVFFGTGIKSEEARRIFESKDSRIKSRLYAYVDEGKGVRPEQGVGGHAHRVQLDNLYDLKADPLGIRSKIRDANERESAILDAGFNGYYAPGVFGDQGVAILMGGAATRGVAPDAYLGTGKPETEAPSNPLAGRKDLPMGKMTGAEWKKLVPEAKVEDDQTYYKDDLKFSRGRAQTETPEFKKWFGVSKVVDAEGKPLVVYHGTKADFSEFNPDSHFGSIGQAENILANSRAKTGKQIMPVYLSIQKLKRVKDVEIAQRWKEEVAKAKRQGYDGLVYENEFEGGGDSYIAFSPAQIKSATGNRGTFDPANPDTRASRGRRQAAEAEAERLVDEQAPALIQQYFSRFGNVIDPDNVKKLFPSFVADPSLAAAVHEASSRLAKMIYTEALQRNKGRPVVFTAGGGGSGKSEAMDIALKGSGRLLAGKDPLIYDSTLSSFASAKARIDAALASGAPVTVLYTNRPVAKAFAFAMRRDRVVPASVLASAHAGAADTIRALSEHYASNEKVSLLVINNPTDSLDDMHLGDIGDVFKYDKDVTERSLHEQAKQALDSGRISREKYDALLAGSLGSSLQQGADGLQGSEQGQDTGRSGEGLDAKQSIGRIINDTIRKVDAAVDGLSNLPNQFDYLNKRYLALGKIARVDEIIKEIRQAFTQTDPANKRAVYNYLTTRGASAAGIPDANVRAIAERIKRTISYVGDQLVARGLLDQQARDHYRDQYLPRMYLRHMLNDQDYKVLGMGKKPSDMGYLKHRKDIPPEIREVVLGEVKDPAFLSASAIGRAMRDVSLLDWMGQISQNNDWVFPEVFVPWQGKRVTAYWLRAEADRIENQAQHYDDVAKQKATALVAAMRQASATALGNMSAIDHKKYKQIPDTMRYGLLRGMWVRNEIFDDIMGASQIVNADPTWFEDWFGFGGKGTKLTQWWKFTKVALNPPGQIRNFISNMVMLQLSGIGLHKLPLRLIEAARDISNDGPYWKVAKKYGVTESTFTAQELFRIKRDLIALEAQSGKLNNLRWLVTAGAKFLDGVSNLYQFSEALGKTIKIIDEMKKGKSEAEAALEAQKWLFDYSLVPQSVRIARNAPIGMPFLTYQVKVLPRLMEVAAKYPWRFLPWAGLLYGMQAAVASMFGVDDDDLKKLKKSLPQWLQDRGHTVFLPMRDKDGRLQVADVGYFFPWTFYTQTGQHLAEGNLKKGLVDDIGGQFSAPIIGAANALMTNYDSFTKQPIYHETDPVSYQAASITNFAYDLMAPPFLSSHGFVSPMGLLDKKFGGKIVQAEANTTNKFGDPKATEGQAVAGLLGVNFYGMDPEHTRMTNLKVMQAKTLEAEKTLRSRLMDRGLTTEERAQLMNDYRERMLDLNKEMLKYAAESNVPEQLRVRK